MKDVPLVAIDRLTFGYAPERSGPGGLVLNEMTFSLDASQTTAIMGANGSGKSTLARLLAGQLTPFSGSIRWNATRRHGYDVFYADQSPMNTVFPWQTVQHNLDWPLRQLDWSVDLRRKRIEWLLRSFCLSALADALPNELSGGELQRLAVARAVSWKPRCVILDEALSALDRHTWSVVVGALAEIRERDGITFVLITHHLADVIALADRCLILEDRASSMTDVAVPLGRQRDPESAAAAGVERELFERLRHTWSGRARGGDS